MDSLSRHHPVYPSFLLLDSSAEAPSPPDPPKPRISGSTVITTLIVIVVIIIIVGAFRIYVHLFRRRHRRRPIVLPWLRNQEKSSGGLDKAIVNSLPTFTYKTQLPHSANLEFGPPECAVCLIEFQDSDACRLLPKCSHIFHTECIDKWFLWNTTCPMCRTAAEMVDAENMHHTESMTACLLPHEDLTEQPHGSDSSLYCQELSNRAQRLRSRSTTCLPLHRDITIQMQRTRSIGHFSREQDEGLGIGLHVREILARTFSCKSSYGRLDMVGQETKNGAHSINTMKGNMSVDDSNMLEQRDHSLRSHASEVLVKTGHLPHWLRSASDRYVGMKYGLQYPTTNVLFWGNDVHVMSRSCREHHWQVRGRSLPHMSIEMPKLQDSSSPRGLSTSSSPSLCLPAGEQRPPPCAFSPVVHTIN